MAAKAAFFVVEFILHIKCNFKKLRMDKRKGLENYEKIY